METHAFDLANYMLKRGQTETCFIVLSPPSPLAVSPELTQFLSEVMDEATEYSKLMKMNALFVDGNDEDNIDLLLEYSVVY